MRVLTFRDLYTPKINFTVYKNLKKRQDIIWIIVVAPYPRGLVQRPLVDAVNHG